MRWFAVSVIFLSTLVQAETVQVGRYISVEATATEDQMDPLNVVIELSFPSQVKTVGDAIDNLLVESGYRLADNSVQRAATDILLNLPLPRVHRSMGPISLKEALIVLAGKPHRLVVDPVRRWVTYDLKKEYHAFMYPVAQPTDRKIPELAEVQP